ncbi:N-acetylmuramoyl-L-alanine amidase [Cyclobacterium lianum]|uniref:N-acetylmuramoyl-L-alanine amidase n=1 Tax=Cyclobacterium lianum TaxID=388280 RepID=A0A1M7P6Y6_9BACT|nr:N-acetylmuramoyl-L-alanine amidase [Cyclobacterium lianum]SHN12455.1 N-acetylmuramoyl-L-alanine amidase [Cyclobacterium lianum]
MKRYSGQRDFLCDGPLSGLKNNTGIWHGFVLLLIAIGSLVSYYPAKAALSAVPPLDGKVICIDPGHGGTAATDSYRVGPSGEREEWVNLRVALVLSEMLEEAGATVVLTRTDDTFVPLEDRSRMARKSHADIFVSIHHNATADPTVNFPIVYFHGSALENPASVNFGKIVAERLRNALFENQGPFSLVSDYTIFSNSGASVLRGTYGIPGIIAEASFFTHPGEERRLKREKYNRLEARAYFDAIAAFFSAPVPEIRPKKEPGEIPPFEVFQEAERMRPEALQWKSNYERGKALLESGSEDELDSAYHLLTLSVRSFPDSYLAGDCHRLRASVLEKQGKAADVRIVERRLRAFYP